jgi:hypothetical protein
MSLRIVTSEGPLGLGKGHSRTLVWKDARGSHKVYAFGYESKDDAKIALLSAAKENGFIEKKWWQFWR